MDTSETSLGSILRKRAGSGCSGVEHAAGALSSAERKQQRQGWSSRQQDTGPARRQQPPAWQLTRLPKGKRGRARTERRGAHGGPAKGEAGSGQKQ